MRNTGHLDAMGRGVSVHRLEMAAAVFITAVGGEVVLGRGMKRSWRTADTKDNPLGREVSAQSDVA